MSDAKNLESMGSRNPLEQQTKKGERFERGERFQNRIIQKQLQIQQALTNNPNLSRQDFIGLLGGIHPSKAKREFIEAFEAYRRQKKAVEDILVNPEYFTDGKIDPLNLFNAVVGVDDGYELNQADVELVFKKEFPFLYFKVNEDFSSTFLGVMCVKHHSDLGSIMIEGKSASDEDFDLNKGVRHELEHVIQRLICKVENIESH